MTEVGHKGAGREVHFTGVPSMAVEVRSMEQKQVDGGTAGSCSTPQLHHASGGCRQPARQIMSRPRFLLSSRLLALGAADAEDGATTCDMVVEVNMDCINSISASLQSTQLLFAVQVTHSRASGELIDCWTH